MALRVGSLVLAVAGTEVGATVGSTGTLLLSLLTEGAASGGPEGTELVTDPVTEGSGLGLEVGKDRRLA